VLPKSRVEPKIVQSENAQYVAVGRDKVPSLAKRLAFDYPRYSANEGGEGLAAGASLLPN